MDWQKYLKPEVWHPAARLFPLMREKQLAQLAEDIKRYRLLHPITLIGELVLDGRNRLLACAKAGVEPWFAQFNDQRMGPVQWVISQNFHRRHLTSSQATTVALEALPLLEEEAKGRREATSKYASRDNKGKLRPVPQTIGEPEHGRLRPGPQTIGKLTGCKHEGEAAQKAAILFNTNRQYIQDAKLIRAKDPQLHEAIKRGEVTIPQAKQKLGMAKERITLLFDPEIQADKKILDFLLRLPRKTRSDTINEIMLQGIEKEESPYLRSPGYPASLLPNSAPGTPPDHELRETQESTEDERIDSEELIDSIVDSFTKS
ncbi:MAG: hypothetical protein O7G28_10225 [Deltaproteobacteria bacterium]|nr:hypothetical protein [Deltaproteobacteria bacterium]